MRWRPLEINTLRPWRPIPGRVRLLSMEIVEVNPVVDEHKRTAGLAVELACSAFGKKIL